MTASEIIQRYISFFETRGHKRIENSSLVPLNDPTTLFTSSGMQPLVPFLLGEIHPAGKKLVNVQNCFRAQDIDEIGDNRHTTFFRMLGNWSLGEYFKKEQIPFFFEFLTDTKEGVGLEADKLYVTVFKGFESIPQDDEAITIWQEVFKKKGIEAKLGERIFTYGVEKNWWSRAGTPDKMPSGEPGGPDSEVFYDFGDTSIHETSPWKDDVCHVNCDCGRFLEIGNSVFMEFKKTEQGFIELPQKNVDFGGGLERLVAVSEHQQDVFKTSLFYPVIESIEKVTGRKYEENEQSMRIVTDHFIASSFIILSGITPSNKEQGYILRRLIRRGFDSLTQLGGEGAGEVLETVAFQYKDTDREIIDRFELVKNTVLEEIETYKKALHGGRKLIEKELKMGGIKLGDELTGVVEIPAETAFKAITSYGLGPTQLKSLGYTFNDQELAEKIKAHQDTSRKGAAQKFAGGLADHDEKTVMGHTATHLMHQALRDVLGNSVHQTGSNITSERVRFDFSFDRKLTEEEILKVETIVNEKIQNNIPVHFEIIPLLKAKDIGAIGLFDEKYQDNVKVYFVGGSSEDPKASYSKEFCGGPHVDFTGRIKKFKIIKEEGISKGSRRIYATVE